MRLHVEVILIAFLDVMHLRVALTVQILGRTRRINQRGIDDSALSQRKAPVAEVTLHHRQNPSRQLVLLQQAAKFEDGGFIRNALHAQPGEPPQDRGLVQRIIHSRT